MRACALLLVLGATAAAQETLAVEPLRPDPVRDARVAELIEALRGIEAPHGGITCWSGGGVSFSVADDDAPPVFRELARIGPAAIPALLDHLTDKRRTRLSFRMDPEAIMGGMYFLPEIPAGDGEELARIRRALGVTAVKDGPRSLELPDERLDGYTVTVGDCCFAILGEIVNRSYEAVRYQPTLIFIVSSPTQEPGIAKVLRGRWGRADPRQLLAESLLRDLRRGCGGAEERLALYFPDESGPMVARGIASLFDERYPYRDNHYRGGMLARAVRTGHPLVRAEWLKLLDPSRAKASQLAALEATPEDPGDDARERVRAILDRTTDVEILLACLRALPGEKPEGLQGRLERLFAPVETRDQDTARHALSAMAILDDERSLPIFARHMERVGDWGSANVVYALSGSPSSRLAAALLPKLLDAKAGVSNHGVPHPIWMGSDTRLCDWAAHLLNKSRPELAFDSEAPVEERDRQIVAMRAALAR